MGSGLLVSFVSSKTAESNLLFCHSLFCKSVVIRYYHQCVVNTYNVQEQHRRFSAAFPNATFGSNTYIIDVVISGEPEKLST